MLDDSLHTGLKFLKGDLAVLVLINLSHDLIPDLLTALVHMTATKDCLQLFFTNRTVTISIKHPEGPHQIVTREEQVLLECGGNELRVVYRAIAIQVCTSEHLFNVRLVNVQYLSNFRIACSKFIKCEVSIIVGVKLNKHLTDLS